ncbi:rhodanese-like domain-containing protein [Chloroflexota bacterium]
MNRNIFLPLVISLLLVFGAAMAIGCSKGAQIEDVSAQDAYSLIQDNRDNPDFVLIDVRTPKEFAEGHIEGAVNIDYNSGSFREEIDKLDRGKIYLIHCRSGRRSQGALGIMMELEFTKIYHMTGGMIEWVEEELPTVK